MARPMLVERSKSLLRALLVLSVGMSVLAAGFALRSTAALASGAERAEIEQKSLRLQPGFQVLCERLRAALPADANVLLEPSRLEPLGLSPQARWHLLFNYELAPIRCYTREPAAASGTLVDWPRWVERHFPGAVLPPEQALAPIPGDVFEQLLAERRIQWRITYPQGGALATKDVRLWRRESGMWKPVALGEGVAVEPTRPLRALAAALATALCLGIGGSGILRWCTRRQPHGLIEWSADGLGLGLVLGAALVLGGCWWAGAGLSIGAGRALLGAAAALGVVGWWLGSREPRQHAVSTAGCRCAPWTSAERVLALCCLAFSGYALLQAYGVPLHRFDSTQHFAYKGRLLLDEGLGTAGWRDLSEPIGRIVTHPKYPPLLGALTALCSCVLGAFDADAGKMLAALFLPLGAVWLFRWFSYRSRTAGLVAALSWSALPFLYYAWQPAADAAGASWLGLLLGGKVATQIGATGFVEPYYSDLLDGTGDLPLAALALGAALALRELWRTPERGAALVPLLGALTAGLLLVKNEGLPLAALLVVGAVLVARRSLPLRRLAAALGIAAALYLPWWLVQRHLPNIDENYGELLRPAQALQSLDRVAIVGAEYADSFCRLLRWNLLWPLCAFALGIALCAPRRVDRATWLAALALFGGLALYFVVLLVTPWDLKVLFSTFIPDRLFVHVAPLALAFVVGVAWPAGRESA
jgi:hypothetical protein